MIDMAIISDDLTGACDSGIKIAGSNEIQVLLDSSTCDAMDRRGCHIFSINTNTRNADATRAYGEVYRTILQLRREGFTLFYKKVDSVLRGNIGCEIDAALDALRIDLAIIATSFPDNGRIVREGKLQIVADGQIIPSEYGAQSICAGSRRRGRTVPLQTVREGAQAIAKSISRLVADGAQLVVLDAQTNGDLREIAKGAELLETPYLPVGSAGLIASLWEESWRSRFHGEGRENSADCACPTSKSFTAVVVGSRHPNTVAQIQQLKKRSDLRFYQMKMEMLGEDTYRGRVNDMVEAINRDLESGLIESGVVITTDRIYQPPPHTDRNREENISNPVLTRCLAEVTNQLISRHPFNKLIMTGGDVANSVLKGIGVRQIRLLNEPMPGIVSAVSRTDHNKKVMIATKSGGFGEPSALDSLVDYLGSKNPQNGHMAQN